MYIDRVNKVFVSEPIVVHRVRLVEKEPNPTAESATYIRISPVIVYETTYDSSGKIGQTSRLLNAVA